jgi:hypothetical protein
MIGALPRLPWQLEFLSTIAKEKPPLAVAVQELVRYLSVDAIMLFNRIGPSFSLILLHGGKSPGPQYTDLHTGH